MKVSVLDLPEEEGTSYLPFNDATLPEAETVVRESFGDEVVPLLKKILRNPVCTELPSNECGDIVCKNGEPVGFEALMPKRLYLRGKPILGSVASTMGIKNGESPLVLLSLMKRNITRRSDSSLWFANTANATSVKMNRKLGIKGRGPETWERIQYAVIHPLAFAVMVVRRKLMKCIAKQPEAVTPIGNERVLRTGELEIIRMAKIDREAFDAFWGEFLKANAGLVSSRTAAEIEWMFGDRVASGLDVLLMARCEGRIVGFTVVRSGVDAWWRIVDLIALKNDATIIDALLVGVKRFLKKRTKAALLESRGFPSFATRIIGKHLPHTRPAGGNTFLWQFFDSEIEKSAGDFVNDGKSWFFGPYDGDADL